MNVAQFDHLTRALTNASSRRDLLRGLAIACGLTSVAPSGDEATAGRKNKRRKKIKRNRFGCVNVGGTCRGRDSVCCSGICQGKKPKKGKKDKSTCVGHHEGICTPAHRACTSTPQPKCNPDHPAAKCYRTTGKAGFCGLDVIPACIPCRKDADCHQQLSMGAACVACSACPEGKGMCVPRGID